ncbi:hypothetical protein OIV83_000433 [Microbotryomycetes sp. JL201]|nr:hypothetical protein OIV83_000433 [Microbotryomycetes sp. JL201]
MSSRAAFACSACLKQLHAPGIGFRLARKAARPSCPSSRELKHVRALSTTASGPEAATSNLGSGSASSKTRHSRWATTAILSSLGAAVAYAAWPYLNSTKQTKLSPYGWTPLKITRVTPVTADSSIITLQIPKSMLSANAPDDRSQTQISSLYVMQPDLQIQRPYTLLVKRYADGEVSRFLHRLKAGDELSVRGPVPTWQFDLATLDEVVFIVGGTGVTPAYQFLRSLPLSASTRVCIIYASPSPSQVLVKQELDQLVAAHSNSSIRYLVDVMDNQPDQSAATRQFSVGRVSAEKLNAWIGSARQVDSRRAVVVCGPEPMVEAVAGPRARDLSQGPVGGMLRQLGYSDDQVVKL